MHTYNSEPCPQKNRRHRSPVSVLELSKPSVARIVTLPPESGVSPGGVRLLVRVWQSRSFTERVVKVLVVVAMALHVTDGPAEVRMETLSAPDGSLPMGRVGAVSSDGSAITGSRWALDDYLPETFRWESGTNVVEVTPGGASTNPNAYVSEGRGVSDNHGIVVGWKHEGQPGAFAWVDGAPVALTQNRGSRIMAISRDGAVGVGSNPTTIAAASVEAVSWLLSSGIPTVLPDLAGGATRASAEAISADRTTIVGWGTDAVGRQACRWLGGTVWPLGDLPGGRGFSEATAVSANGGVIVGRGCSAMGIEAFRWSSGTGIQGLGDLPGGCEQSEATSVSDDGTVIVGIGHSDLGTEVFVWNTTNGLRSLRTLMKAAGEDISGWNFDSTRPVLSGDGNVLAGDAVDPDQNPVLFRLTGMNEMTNGLVATWMTWHREESEIVLRFPTEPGLRYQVQGAAAPSGATWASKGNAVIGTGAEAEARCESTDGTGCGFYRLLISN